MHDNYRIKFISNTLNSRWVNVSNSLKIEKKWNAKLHKQKETEIKSNIIVKIQKVCATM